MRANKKWTMGFNWPPGCSLDTCIVWEFCGTSTRWRALKPQRFCPFTLNGVTSRFAELHCGSVARLSRAMFYFWSFDGSVSQSNHMPVQALANQTASLCVRGRRFMWLVEFQTRLPASFNARRHVDAALQLSKDESSATSLLGCVERVGPKCRLQNKVKRSRNKSELYSKSWTKTWHETHR